MRNLSVPELMYTVIAPIRGRPTLRVNGIKGNWLSKINSPNEDEYANVTFKPVEHPFTKRTYIIVETLQTILEGAQLLAEYKTC